MILFTSASASSENFTSVINYLIMLNFQSSGIQFSRNHIHAAHCQYGVGQHRAFYHFRIRLIEYKTRSSEMQPKGRSSSVADQVKTKFTISTFDAVIHLTLWYIS